jgi:flavodoxin
MGKTLIAYFSKAGENNINGDIVKLAVGNTEVAANYIKEFIPDADMFKIDQVEPLPESYEDCFAKAKVDQSAKLRPEIKDAPESIDEYDTIFLGGPNYIETYPMAVFTFLEKYNWEGKTIKPFITHEGSSFGHAIEDITTVCKGAEIKEGLSIHGADVRGFKIFIKRWINK